MEGKKEMKIKLYRNIDGKERLVDYGVLSQISTYEACGYTVKTTCSKKEVVWKQQQRKK